MAINKKLIHFRTKAAFTTELNAGNIPDTSIVFIKDTKEIWTHGQLYSCSPLTEEEINSIIENSPSISELTQAVSNKVDSVDGKGLSTNDYTNQEKKDLADLKSGKVNNTLYKLPDAADGVTGGIQIGYAASGKNYAVKLSNKKAYVTVPWTDQNVYQAWPESDTTIAFPILGSPMKLTAGTEGKAGPSVQLQGLTFTPNGNVLSVGTGEMVAAKFTGALNGNAKTATSATSATKATQDSSGNNIVNTYQTKAGFNSFKNEFKDLTNAEIDNLWATAPDELS